VCCVILCWGSQFTSFLDKIGTALEATGTWHHARLDGSMTSDARKRAVATWKEPNATGGPQVISESLLMVAFPHRSLRSPAEVVARPTPPFVLCFCLLYAQILLVSTRAGGTGLNLTDATHAFLMDCWWNAAVGTVLPWHVILTPCTLHLTGLPIVGEPVA
jgi:hypothetical protein